MSLNIATIVGTRPQFIKSAPVSEQFRVVGVKEHVINTGQHFDTEMSGVFFDDLGLLPPARNLNAYGATQTETLGRMMMGLEKAFAEIRPDAVVVYGDTNTTLAGALIASRHGYPLVHVEAGLRSHNKSMPEEINRIVADHCSSLLLCPTYTAVKELEREGIAGDHVIHTGDVMYDLALRYRPIAEERSSVIEHLELEGRDYAIATVHRQENTDDPEALKAVFDYLEEQARDVPIVLPLHPRTRNAINGLELSLSGVTLIPPLGYIDMVRLTSGAARVYTDSGGLQKEAYFYGVPSVILRNETEWVELINSGWSVFWRGAAPIPSAQALEKIDDFGDGNAAVQVVAAICETFPEVTKLSG